MGATLVRGVVIVFGALMVLGGLAGIIARRPERPPPASGASSSAACWSSRALLERTRYRSEAADGRTSRPGPGGGEPQTGSIEARFRRDRGASSSTRRPASGCVVLARPADRRAAVPRRRLTGRASRAGPGYDRRPSLSSPAECRTEPCATPARSRSPARDGRRRSRLHPARHAASSRARRTRATRPADASDPLPQPRAVLARVQRPGAPRGARRAQPAARAGHASWRSSRATSTSSSRSGSPACASRSRPASVVPISPDGRTAERAAGRRPRAGPRARRRALRRSTSSVRRALAAEGVEIVDYAAIPEHHDALRQRFLDEIFPVLTPLAVDPGHPFPYISTLSACRSRSALRDPETGERRFARVKVPADPAAPARGRARRASC